MAARTRILAFVRLVGFGGVGVCGLVDGHGGNTAPADLFYRHADSSPKSLDWFHIEI
jgi:hypothetical protein